MLSTLKPMPCKSKLIQTNQYQSPQANTTIGDSFLCGVFEQFSPFVCRMSRNGREKIESFQKTSFCEKRSFARDFLAVFFCA
jgi:hypothetical protein